MKKKIKIKRKIMLKRGVGVGEKINKKIKKGYN